jgi:phosphopantothenoylcysteine decarboxylase / phosphopantothenate---cysteine ligase
MRILITAGPTREAIDPVRFISNRSSGKMGFALAGALASAGHEVVLVAGPVGLATPAGVTRHDVVSAADMTARVADVLPACGAAFFAAAVADYTPVSVAPQKIKKSSPEMTLTLRRTTDILGSVRSVWRWPGYLVGFAAETENLLDNARAKLVQKGCDSIIANRVGTDGPGLESDDNEVVILRPAAPDLALGPMEKNALAEEIVAVYAPHLPSTSL